MTFFNIGAGRHWSIVSRMSTLSVTFQGAKIGPKITKATLRAEDRSYVNLQPLFNDAYIFMSHLYL